MSATPSLRQLARLIGVSEKAVRKALRAGVFKGSVRRDEPDGAPVVLDLALAVSEWEQSGRTLRGDRERRSSPAPTAVAQAPAPASAPDDDAEPADDSETPAPGAPPPSLVDAQTAAMVERARKLRMENDVRSGQLLEVDRASREAFEFARVLRENVLNVPARLAAELAAETDAARVHIRLDAALREALEATAAVLDGADNAA